MSDLSTLTRAEVAKLLGIATTSLSKLLGDGCINMPAPVGKRRCALTYDAAEIMAWIATKPLSGVRWSQSKRAEPAPLLNADHTRLFLSGDLGLSKAQRNHHQRRKVIAKHRRAKTDRVEVSGSDEFHGACDAWAGLV